MAPLRKKNAKDLFLRAIQDHEYPSPLIHSPSGRACTRLRLGRKTGQFQRGEVQVRPLRCWQSSEIREQETHGFNFIKLNPFCQWLIYNFIKLPVQTV
jgi:hypothetical protein